MNPPPPDATQGAQAVNPLSVEAGRLTTHQQVVVVVLSVLLLLFIIHMVRRRAIREEYSVLWLAAGILVVLATVFYSVTLALTHLFGAVAPTTAVFLLSILFLVVLNIQITVVLSRQTTQIHRLSQELALLNERLEQAERKEP